MKRLALSILGVISCIACTKPGLGNDSVSFDDYVLYDFYEDGIGNRGIVFIKEQDDNGAQYIIVLSSDEVDAGWGPENKFVYSVETGGSYSRMDTGYLEEYPYAIDVNQRVALFGNTAYPAFAWCHNKNGGGEQIHASSWILPSLKMMQKALGDHHDDVNAALLRNNMSPLSTSGYYWTCTEDIDEYLSDSSNDRFRYGYDPVTRAIPISYDAMQPLKKTVWQKENVHHTRAVKIIHYKTPINNTD